MSAQKEKPKQIEFKLLSMPERLEKLDKYRRQIVIGGGPKRIEKQHEAGKMTARERLDKFFDLGSFMEINLFAGRPLTEKMEYPGEGVVVGFGTVNGRPVYAFAQDFTVSGGSLGHIHAEKIWRVLDLGAKNGAPVVGFNDSGGARIQEGVDALDGYGEIFYRNTIASGVIPQISVIMGPCAGGAVYSPALTDFIFMVDKTSYMFITGPQVIKSVTGEEVSTDDLGGALTHNQTSGVAHFFAEDEDTCLEKIKALLSYLPSNNLEEAPLVPPREPEGNPEELLNIIPDDPNRAYDVKKIIRLVVDGGELLEVHEHYARNGVVGFARINGQAVGIIANQPNHLAGCLDINVSDKISRFVRFCDCFNLPIITFVDVPGYLPGTDQEYGGIIRHGAKILYAYCEATVPEIQIILRKAYGGAYLAMSSRSMHADSCYAWPTAEIAVMGPEGAVNIIKRDEITKAEDPNFTRKKLVAEYKEMFANPYVAATLTYVEDVIDPRDTRKKIITALKMHANKRETRPRKKHGNFPV